MERFEAAVSERLVLWIHFVHHNARAVLALIALLTVGLAAYAALYLGINSDNVTLIAEHLEARKNYLEFARSFPNVENVLLVVVDGETPEIARRAADELEQALSAKSELFRDVHIPGSGEFFERNGLLYRDLEDLDEFSLQIATVQPILTALERDPTVANLASLIEKGLESNAGDDSLDELSVILDRVGDATVQVYREYPLEVSWEEILLRGSSIETVTRWVIVIDPALDFGSLFAAAKPIAEVRRVAEELELDPDHGVTVRLTGNPALNFEEMVGILWNIGIGGIICFFFVIFVLIRAFHSLRLVVAAVITLLTGLIWTAAFAAASVGSLNLISVSFGILFIGLGVDFTIHLGMAYADALRRLPTEERAVSTALGTAFRQVGSSLVLCTATTAIGFYVFIPTDNIGVAELGLIAGSGMVINLLLTTTLFPALLSTVLRLDPARDLPREMRFRSTWWRGLTQHPKKIAGIALVLFILGAWAAADVQFDANVVLMRDPNTESVQAFNDLLEEAGARSPWSIDAIAPDLEAAEAIAREAEKLPVVEMAVSLADYVPTNQDDKIPLLEDVSMILDAPRGTDPFEESLSTAEQIEALQSLHDYLDTPAVDTGQDVLTSSMRSLRTSLREFLDRTAEADEESRENALATLEQVLLGGLTDQLKRLRDATLVEPVELDDLPDELRDRMIAKDGRARVQIFPKEQLTTEAALTRFAVEVQAVVPNATGLPMNLVAFAQATRDSFSEALVYAVVLISTILFLLWRRVEPVLLVLAPLVLSNAVTVGVMTLLGISFNFVNVVVIPLLLGIGVDSGIHLVHRAESLAESPSKNRVEQDLLSSTTARAVFYSALTTTVSFGTLALSSHRGISTLGIVLSMGMAFTVISNLVVLPALISLRQSARSSPDSIESASESQERP